MDHTAAARDEITGTLADVHHDLNQLATTVSQAFSILPDSVLSGVADQWSKLLELWQQLRETIQAIVDNPGNPQALRTTALSWDTSVGGLMSSIAGRADRSSSKIVRYWEGDAVEAYLATLPAQRSAMEAVKETISDPISSMLEDLATAIEWFLYGTLAALTILASAIAIAIVLAATGFGAPAAVKIAASGLAICISTIVSLYYTIRTTASSQQNTLQQRSNDNLAFPDGRWPTSALGW